MAPKLRSTDHVAPKACDRCHAFKTQCSFETPCLRCKGLGLECSYGRASRPRGRPRKATSAAQPKPPDIPSQVPPNVSTPDRSDGSSSPHDLPELPLERGVIDPLLHRLLTSIEKQGFYDITTTIVRNNPWPDRTLPRSLRYVLHAVSLELYGYSFPTHMQPQLQASRRILQDKALSLATRMNLNDDKGVLADALCLLLLSYTWCMTQQSAAISLRWCSLADVFLHDIQGSFKDSSSALEELVERAIIALRLHQSTLFLTHDCLGKWPNCRPLRQTNQQPVAKGNSFFDLFEPFTHIIPLVAQEPASGSSTWREAKRRLETFFFDFPEDLLKFGSAKYAYQLEAMVWHHGLFLVLYSTKDFSNLLRDPTHLQPARFTHLLDHSLLLGEVLPSLLRLDPYMESISPGTVYFVFLSCAIHCLALHQFPHQATPPPPPKLLRSCSSHLEIIDALEAYCRRCDVLLVREFQRLLTSTISTVTEGFAPGPIMSCHVLYLYRWTAGGSGMVQLKERDALREWAFIDKPTDPLWNGTTGADRVLVQAICELCDDRRRICEAGFFDLSISVTI
ncbi:hypothetical protein BJY00DRAFT_293540 [Aspergillus carlsbadensis]|nr:hypothetical protein BJY00DRAFT_293540 [Aspergillus carlsbadensis]